MDRSCVIYLIGEDVGTGVDDYGDPIITRTRVKRFASVASIGTNEFYQAQTAGVKPEFKFILAMRQEYNGEEFVEYDAVIYKVLRTYVNSNDGIEITCYSGVRLEEWHYQNQ